MPNRTPNADDWPRIVDGLLAEDALVVQEFCERYGQTLRAIADRQISRAMKQRFDASDVVQSAFRSFFRRARDGQFQVSDGDKLWSLICAIVLNKLREKARFHSREQRSVGREVQAESLVSIPGISFNAIGQDLDSTFILEFEDQIQHFMLMLDEEQQHIIDLKLQNKTNAQIARLLESSERTIERQTAKLYRKLKQMFDE